MHIQAWQVDSMRSGSDHIIDPIIDPVVICWPIQPVMSWQQPADRAVGPGRGGPVNLVT